jgi:hypothetical protein
VPRAFPVSIAAFPLSRSNVREGPYDFVNKLPVMRLKLWNVRSGKQQSESRAPICGRSLLCEIRSRVVVFQVSQLVRTLTRSNIQWLFYTALECVFVYFPAPVQVFTAQSDEFSQAFARVSIRPAGQRVAQPVVQPTGQLCSRLCSHLQRRSAMGCAASDETRRWNGYRFGLCKASSPWSEGIRRSM